MYHLYKRNKRNFTRHSKIWPSMDSRREDLERIGSKATTEGTHTHILSEGNNLAGSLWDLMALMDERFASHCVCFPLCHSQLV